MKTINLGNSGFITPAIAVGCMRINKIEKKEAESFIKTALDLGANFFDHADRYGNGACESIFADAIGMSSSVRENILLQSKCGIRQGYFDFSKEHILKSVDESLKKLKTSYLDVLLLHRPDALMECEEVAEAFSELHTKGKVRHFGVSNQNPSQIQLLQKFVKQPLIINQLQLSITNATMISEGLHVNMNDDAAVNRNGGVLDFCRLHDITIQAWSPFQYGTFEGVFLGNEKFPTLNAEIDKLAEKYGVSNTSIALAWIFRHPAKIQPITGTMNSGRLRDCIAGSEITLTREEWYGIYKAAGNTLP
ncbi:oxidoreductase YdhF [Treponema primitia ZAS-2]|uniref:Oxidoreductase YdhF n=1 Tax=Treponema primitia (strain ATCC BAA-887 / DSM 12427 / ZAS-2) TaxID=545694 RepID=F5YNT5_TREPZ|nr:aldo/keto reductase [Treponema primitia]AEF84161.1 oxidoreductase YdhF [Treponema primitia ZAS-2]